MSMTNHCVAMVRALARCIQSNSCGPLAYVSVYVYRPTSPVKNRMRMLCIFERWIAGLKVRTPKGCCPKSSVTFQSSDPGPLGLE